MGKQWRISTSTLSTQGIRVKDFFYLMLLLICSNIVIEARHLMQQQEANSDTASLLAFKEISVVSDPNGILSTWKEGSDSPCSSWKGVSCSSDGKVNSLDLSDGSLSGPLYIGNLTAMPGLRFLNLHGNSFSSGDLAASSSCNLESVDLSFNNLSSPLPSKSFLLSCTRLIYVNLSHNSIPGGSLEFGSSLLELDMSKNSVSDSSLLIKSLTHCQNLNLIDFSSNKLTGNLSFTPSPCKNLSFLDLSGNQLSGQVPAGLISISPVFLKHLDLSNNNFSGKFSGLDFSSCGNLTFLNFSQNFLSGGDFPTTLRNCQLLETLDLSHNALQDSIPGAMLGGFKKLKHLSLAHNHFVGEIPSQLALTCPTLQELDLSMNNLSGGLPLEFSSCSSLWSLNLGNNQLSGDFITTVIANISSLNELYLPLNKISGIVPLSLVKNSRLRVLDLSSNEFTGNISPGFCSSANATSFSSLEKIRLANNYLSGTVPLELGKCKNLKLIDLSFNNLNGEIPKEIWDLPNLLELIVWANNLTGEIPQDICDNGGNLETLILNNNMISGSIPESISKCTNMIWVSLSSNRLTGTIPASIGNLPYLAILQLGNNSLVGQIPPELGNFPSLIWLDLNSNDLTGSIPPRLANQSGLINPGSVSGKQFAFVRNEGGTKCRGAGGLFEFAGIRESRLESFPMVHSCPSTRIYLGMAVYTFASNGSMIYLDLSYNHLSGNIPENFGSMGYLMVLNLGHNNLTGTIPDRFGELTKLGVLDLSHNYLQGYIPGSLGSLNFLNDFDVSNNQLSGSIPQGGQLTTFPLSRFDNNSGLCGVPLPPCGSGGGPNHTKTYNGEKKQSFAAGMVSGISFFLALILILMAVLIRVKRNQKKGDQREKYIESLPTSGSGSWKVSSANEPLSINVATFEKPLRKLTFAHLLEATNGFSAESLIGSGGFGEVYKAKLKDGTVVAIKKLIHVTSQGDREFMAEMETIGKIKHRNLVPLMGYCKVGEERLLVYEYMKWGSLEAVLHDKSKGVSKLDWGARKKIAIGSARGLAFLHHSCVPHIIHRDMKSSNVLLDENLEARVSDFGMARLVNALDTHLSVSTLAGTPGYVPPEYYQSFRCTVKGDVYSYGVILLELLSGRRPIDSSVFGDDQNIVGWAKKLQKEKRTEEILDPELMTWKSGDAELYRYLQIAFECLEERPLRRPTMIQVMARFKELQVDSESDVPDDFSVKNIVIDESLEKVNNSS